MAPSTARRYDADDITVLEGLEPVRVRPGMYVGSTSSRGLHHLLWEIVDNAVDEALAGFCTRIVVSFQSSGVMEVSDDGRGIPVGRHRSGESALDVVFTRLHAGGKFGGGGYNVSGGLHGVGASVTNALSEWLEADVRRDGYHWSVRYKRGKGANGIAKGPKLKKHEGTGTTVRWAFDKTIFDADAAYSYAVVADRLREKSYLVRGLTIVLRWEGHDEQTFSSKNGIADYVADLDVRAERTPVHRHVVFLSSEDQPSLAAKELPVEVALQWTSWSGKTEDLERVSSFANVIATVDGGTHVEGLRAALTQALNRYATEAGKLKAEKKESLVASDVWEGLTAAVSVKLADPQFEGQTKGKLNNAEARSAVQSFTYAAFAAWLRAPRFKKDADAIVARCIEARESRLARSRADSKRKRSVFDESPLPGKLLDCLDGRPVDDRELFIVEGDSALGNCGNARDKSFQAVLPIRGKILNVLGAPDARIWDNKEILSILVAMGGRKEAVGKRVVASLTHEERRYGRIVILSDADTDGAHIAALLMTALHELFPSLIREGRVFLSRPPLFKVNLDPRGERFVFAYSDDELRTVVADKKRKGDDVSRFKGLGEMPWEHLRDTCFKPETRQLQQITVEDAAEAVAAMNLIMGNGPAAAGRRREWLEEVGLELL